MRQIHHWAALIFMAAIVVHMMRVFFTGAFRKPREINWVVGFMLLILGLLAGFTGYSLPDDLLSGTGLRITDGVVLAIPIVGTLHVVLPLRRRVPRRGLHPAPVHGAHPADAGHHPGAHRGCTCSSSSCTSTRSTRARPDRTRTSSATRCSRSTWRRPAASSSSSSASSRSWRRRCTINPVWNYGPYDPSPVSAGAQPDWYMRLPRGIAAPDAGLRRRSSSGIHAVAERAHPGDGHAGHPVHAARRCTRSSRRWITGDNREHHVLDRPRNRPVPHRASASRS